MAAAARSIARFIADHADAPALLFEIPLLFETGATHLGVGLWMSKKDTPPQQITDAVLRVAAGESILSPSVTRRLIDHAVGHARTAQDARETLKRLSERERELGLTNVEPILGEVDDPKLPAGEVDLVLMVDSYHEFDHPREMMAGILAGLKPGGRVALVEYRGEDAKVNIKPLHRMTEAQAKKEMAAAGLEHVETINVLPLQHLMIFRKPEAQ